VPVTKFSDIKVMFTTSQVNCMNGLGVHLTDYPYMSDGCGRRHLRRSRQRPACLLPFGRCRNTTNAARWSILEQGHVGKISVLDCGSIRGVIAN